VLGDDLGRGLLRGGRQCAAASTASATATTTAASIGSGSSRIGGRSGRRNRFLVGCIERGHDRFDLGNLFGRQANGHLHRFLLHKREHGLNATTTTQTATAATTTTTTTSAGTCARTSTRARTLSCARSFRRLSDSSRRHHHRQSGDAQTRHQSAGHLELSFTSMYMRTGRRVDARRTRFFVVPGKSPYTQFKSSAATCNIRTARTSTHFFSI
jgi:hypothetical protein